MHLEVRHAGDVVILDVSGRLTEGFGDELLHDALDELLAEGWGKIVVNLAAVSFIDSAGLGELVAGLKKARQGGAEMKVVAGEGRVKSTLSLSRLLPIFDVLDSEAEAIRRFGSDPG